jgi:hypothetical protein
MKRYPVRFVLPDAVDLEEKVERASTKAGRPRVPGMEGRKAFDRREIQGFIEYCYEALASTPPNFQKDIRAAWGLGVELSLDHGTIDVSGIHLNVPAHLMYAGVPAWLNARGDFDGQGLWSRRAVVTDLILGRENSLFAFLPPHPADDDFDWAAIQVPRTGHPHTVQNPAQTWFVVVLTSPDSRAAATGYIESSWPTELAASRHAAALQDEGASVKVMRRPRVGGFDLDPADEASWKPVHRRNPEPDSARAESVYEMWHQKEPNHVSSFRPGCDGDDVMVCIGKAQNVVYRSGKWEAGRKTNDYVHDFDSHPSVYMLTHIAEPKLRQNPSKTVETLLRGAKNADGQFAVAELAAPLSLELVDGTDIAIHAGSKVYGCVDKRTILICDPHWRLVVIKGGQMTFDERGIVK